MQRNLLSRPPRGTAALRLLHSLPTTGLWVRQPEAAGDEGRREPATLSGNVPIPQQDTDRLQVHAVFTARHGDSIIKSQLRGQNCHQGQAKAPPCCVVWLGNALLFQRDKQFHARLHGHGQKYKSMAGKKKKEESSF